MNVATILKFKGHDVVTPTANSSLLDIAKLLETGRLIGLISIGDLVKMQIADVEMEATATREYAGY